MLAVAMLVLAVLATAPVSEARERPVPPVIVKNHCGFEYGCEFSEPWVASGTLTAFRAKFDTREVFRTSPGESFKSLRADLVIDTLGAALVQVPIGLHVHGAAPTVAAPGDTLHILESSGEGWSRDVGTSPRLMDTSVLEATPPIKGVSDGTKETVVQ
jgi:hypothetical protein